MIHADRAVLIRPVGFIRGPHPAACYHVARKFSLSERRLVMADAVKVYGADWCGDTRHTREVLDRLGVAYKYIDVEQDEQAAQWVRDHNGGKERKPTLDVGGQILSVPTEHELVGALRELGLMA